MNVTVHDLQLNNNITSAVDPKCCATSKAVFDSLQIY